MESPELKEAANGWPPQADQEIIDDMGNKADAQPEVIDVDKQPASTPPSIEPETYNKDEEQLIDMGSEAEATLDIIDVDEQPASAPASVQPESFNIDEVQRIDVANEAEPTPEVMDVDKLPVSTPASVQPESCTIEEEKRVEAKGKPEVMDVDKEPALKPASIRPESCDMDKEERRKRRRMIRRMSKPGATPSFLALIEPSSATEVAPKRIRIDVDDYLGLKKKKEPDPASLPAKPPPGVVTSAVLPADEGWFEGVTPVALVDDARYLPELQVLVRSNLEFFSATDDDVNVSQAGRRTPTVRGKVGVRCIHCSKAKQADPTLSWPPGSISYPVNIAGLYPVCSQKPTQHFQSCPHLPESIKGQFYRLTFDDEGNPRRQRKAPAAAKDETARTISVLNYYQISAKQIGLVDVSGGMRFGRDLALEPLPIETIVAQVEETQSPGKRGGLGISPTPSEPRITADEESERVLAQAVAEKDDEKFLGRSDDNKLVTDFIFLCMKQMAICHAVPSDFSSRGKKAKMMRVGFAGFCCRHCSCSSPQDNVVLNVDFSCRSFASTPDNMASAISNSFYMHIQKCPAVPPPLRNALAVYKRLHSRQMGRLPHGSQRQMFQILWSRLRAADLTAEEMEEKLKSMPAQTHLPSPILSRQQLNNAATGQSESASVPDAIPSATTPFGSPPTRGPTPVCNVEETREILKLAEANEDPAVNDNLILPSDRPLISDFVFLMMKQLKVAHPSVIDFTRGKRGAMVNTGQPGLQCMHCMDKNHGNFFSPGGRSFPSAPDNMASSLNSSLYHHMQKCHYVPEDMKRALSNLKKIHSAQCSSLRFGSQRRFFNIVYERLRSMKLDDVDIKTENEVMPETPSPQQPSTVMADDSVLTECLFLKTTNDCYECQLCRTVPISFRARDSVFIGRPSCEFVRGHRKICKGKALDTTNAAVALSHAINKYPSLKGEGVAQSTRFWQVVKTAIGETSENTDEFCVALTRSLERIQKAEDNGKNDEHDNETKDFPFTFSSTVNKDRVVELFKEFAATTPGMDPDLLKERGFLRFFQIISPSLVVRDGPHRNDDSTASG